MRRFRRLYYLLVIAGLAMLQFCASRGELVRNVPASGEGFTQTEKSVRIFGKSSDTAFIELATDRAFLFAALGEPKVKENLASYKFKDSLTLTCDQQTLDSITGTAPGVVLRGKLMGKGCETDYTLTFKVVSPRQVDFSVELSNKKLNRLSLFYKSDKDEQFFGFGEQFSHFNMKGKEPFLFSEEQGIGRGDQPITFGANLTEGAGGNEYTTYAPVPHYITTRNRSFFFENTAHTKFDLRDDNEVAFSVWENYIKGTIWSAANPLELIEAYTAKSGRMPELPDWAYGSWLGIQGGETKVAAFGDSELRQYEKLNRIIADAEKAGNPVTALWIQDWCGRRITGFGDQLKWRWYADEAMYPNLKDYVAGLKTKNIRVLGYVNSFLADVDPRVDVPGKSAAPFTNPMLEEAKQKGFLVKNAEGKDYAIRTVGFPAYLIDLTNPAAVAWMKSIIRRNLIDIGLSGWMADFGEWLPFDAKMHNGESGATYHNKYPVAWAKLNREAIDEAGKAGEIVFFTRAGYSYSNKYSTAFWAGDQMVTMQQEDGLASTVVALTTSGISGFAINHSDIGGYTTITNPAMFGKYKRSKETMLRWTELNAFTPIFRTHEGNKPKPNHQAYSDTETITFFARFGKIHFALKDYFRHLGKEAAQKGYPYVRALYLHYPDDPKTYNLKYQFLLGADVLVLPVVKKGADSVTGYFPAGEWEHLFTGAIYAGGREHEIAAPIGTPAVFVKRGGAWSERIKAAVR